MVYPRENCRSLGFARDDKWEGGAFIGVVSLDGKMEPSAALTLIRVPRLVRIEFTSQISTGRINAMAFTTNRSTTVLKQDAILYFATPKVHAPDGMFDGTVGHELFTGHVLTSDFHAHRFWMG